MKLKFIKGTLGTVHISRIARDKTKKTGNVHQKNKVVNGSFEIQYTKTAVTKMSAKTLLSLIIVMLKITIGRTTILVQGLNRCTMLSRNSE
jgi:hypothetical protein